MKRAIANSFISTFGAAAAAFALVTIAACNGATDAEGTAEEALTAVEGAEDACGGLDTQIGECLATLKTCLDTAADEDAAKVCHDELAQCAPMQPPPPGGPMGEDGDCPKDGPKGGGHGGKHPPPPPPGTDGGGGGAPPPPPPPPPGDEGGGGAAPVPLPGDGVSLTAPAGAGPCMPGKLLVKPCMDALKLCSETADDPSTCLADAQACIQDAIQEGFQGFCESRLEECAAQSDSSAICDEIAEHCANGVPLPPPRK